jgi:energy-coupling factor transporter ATP-binding protein EcfA2
MSVNPIYFPSFFPQSFNQIALFNIPFPDFSYMRSLRGLESYFRSTQRWDGDPAGFISELLGGTIAPLTVERYIAQKKPDEINFLLSQVMQTILEGDFTFEQILNASQLMRIDGKVDQLSQEILQSKKCYASDNESHVGYKSHASRTKIFSNFIPNLIDTFLKAFNILDAGKKPESIWDYSAMIAIYMSALSLPMTVFNVALHMALTPAYAMTITVMVTTAFLGALYIYLRWLRPLPHDLPNCTNVKDIPTPFFVDREIARELTQAIEAGQNIIVIGETGRGKSTLVRGVGKKLTTKTMQEIKSSVFERDYVAPSSKLEIDFSEAEKYPNQVVFFIDEFDKVVQENLIDFLKVKMDLKKFQCIVVCERENYEAKIKTMRSLDARFPLKIFLPPPSEAELLEMLLGFYKAEGNGVDTQGSPIEIVRYVIAQTTQNIATMRSREQPAAAMEVWNYAIEKMKGKDFQGYQSKEKEAKKQQIHNLETQYSLMTQEEKRETKKELENLNNDLEKIEKNDDVQKRRIKKIQKLSSYRLALRRRFETDARSFKFKDQSALKRNEYMKILEGKLEESIRAEETQLPEDVTLRIDKKYIDAIIKEYIPSTGQESAKSS